ncbi:MAG: TRAP transporter small permease [Firmicutes bacterium]|nr:TRAP transporter small permease [Bacillota bacterium]
MDHLTGLVNGLSRVMDRIAGFCMVAVMVLVVVNILLRTIFNRPILGTYDFVMLLTAVIIGLALAYCAVQNSHIAVSFLVDRLPARIQTAVDIVMNMAALFFWGLCAWQVAGYAGAMAASGVVSPTSQIPIFPFIYLVAFGLLALSLVLLTNTLKSIKRAAERL